MVDGKYSILDLYSFNFPLDFMDPYKKGNTLANTILD